MYLPNANLQRHHLCIFTCSKCKTFFFFKFSLSLCLKLNSMRKHEEGVFFNWLVNLTFHVQIYCQTTKIKRWHLTEKVQIFTISTLKCLIKKQTLQLLCSPPGPRSSRPSRQFVPASERYPASLQRNRQESRMKRQAELLALQERACLSRTNPPPQHQEPRLCPGLPQTRTSPTRKVGGFLFLELSNLLQDHDWGSLTCCLCSCR